MYFGRRSETLLVFSDEDPNQLEEYTGDFVFNPSGTSEIKLTEPVEVLEIGTGFMLVKREVFEKFRDSLSTILIQTRPQSFREF